MRDGELVVLPTDTLYGIGADAFAPDAVRALLDAKGRGRDMPPPVLVPDARTVDGLATEVPDHARDLVARSGPGPLTLVLRAQPSLIWDLGDTGGTVALRMPDDPVALALLREVGPMAVSSANRTGHPGVAHRRRGGQPSSARRSSSTSTAARSRRARVDHRRLHPRRAGLPAGRGDPEADVMEAVERARADA